MVAFHHIDRDGSGEIDFDEFKQLFEKDLNIAMEFHQVQSLFNAIDEDHSK